MWLANIYYVLSDHPDSSFANFNHLCAKLFLYIYILLRTNKLPVQIVKLYIYNSI